MPAPQAVAFLFAVSIIPIPAGGDKNKAGLCKKTLAFPEKEF